MPAAAHVVVALGASAAEARTLVPPHAEVVVVEDWAEGLSATLRQGLRAAVAGRTDAVLVVPVDTPGMPVSAVRRVVEAVAEPWAEALAQAVYRGAPGHPVLIGADHVEPLVETLSGDRGARGVPRRPRSARGGVRRPVVGRRHRHPLTLAPVPERPVDARGPRAVEGRTLAGPRACRGVERSTLRQAQRPNGHRPGVSR